MNAATCLQRFKLSRHEVELWYPGRAALLFHTPVR